MDKLSSQMVGRLGELAVEQELLKRGWMVGNFNASLPNTRAYDLFASKEKRRICIRVKTASGSAIQYSGNNNRAIFKDLLPDDDGDFVVIVFLKNGKAEEFFIVPSQLVKKTVRDANKKWDMHPKKDGTPRETNRQLGLEFRGKVTSRAGVGMREKWKKYRNAWALLE